jgi:16S rRNA (cytidine1402-2'-O)-methyltransferase
VQDADARVTRGSLGIIVSAPGTLFIVATPIGNLADLSARARSTLAEVDLVAAEDTRHSGQLLAQFGIQTPMCALHEHNEAARVAELVARLQGGARIALVSDAGTPLVSDPGYRLVAAAAAAGIPVVPVPGPCAAIAALSVAGLATDRFAFEGFLPQRGAARRARLEALAVEPRTLVFYEAPHRLADALADLAAVFGATREAVVARELTKLHETVYRGPLGELAGRATGEANMARGEIVLVVAGAPATEGDDDAMARQRDRLLGALLPVMPLSTAVDLVSEVTGLRRNRVYERALGLRREAGHEDGA